MRSIAEALESAARAYPIPGFIAAAMADGRMLHASVHGFRDAEAGLAMTLDTVFRLYSMTKAITSAAVLQLVEQGRLNLDEPVASYAPEIGRIEVLTGFDASGAPVMRPPKTPVTMRQLLTHTSGFGYTMWNADLVRFTEWAGRTGRNRGVSPLLDLPMVFDPSEAWEYGVGIDWAGRAIEVLTGKRLGDHLREAIFGPLGMTSTGFWLTPEMAPRFSRQHARTAEGGITIQPQAIPDPPAFHGGGGGLYGGASDYLTFLEAIAGDGAANGVRILKPETLDLMVRIDAASPRVRRLETSAPAITNALDVWGEMEAQWSLAFMVNPKPGPNGRAPGSLAWGGLANTYYWVDRSRRLAGVLMTQLSPFADANALKVFGAFERAVYADLGADLGA